MKSDDFERYLPPRPTPSKEKILLESVHEKSEWIPFLQFIESSPLLTPALKVAFHTKWIESGNFIRDKVNNDEALKRLLSTLLPKYEGEPMILYRGENESRFKSGRIGFCWSSERSVAEMFGRGLNACSSRGILLQAHAPLGAIYSGPNEHSSYLRETEFTVNPDLLVDIKIIKAYPQSH